MKKQILSIVLFIVPAAVLVYFLVQPTQAIKAEKAPDSLTTAPQPRFPPLDKSTMDMSYYPVNYPVLKIQDKASEPLAMRVIYSRPLKNGRKIFGELLEYGKIWRLGANEASEIEFFKDVKVKGKKISKGRYTMYALPYETKWTIIFNKDNDTWGSFKYDIKKDVLRVDIDTQRLAEPLDAYSMVFEKGQAGVNLIIAWDDAMVAVPISF
jgi:Protein of unknown function (DUF2911)